MPNQVPAIEKSKRASQLAEESEKVAARFMDSMIGQTVRVLAEEIISGGITEQESSFITGYSDNYTKVYVAAEGLKNLLNTFISVKITGRYEDGLKGELTNV